MALALTSRPQQQPCASADPLLRPSAAARGCRAATVSEHLAHPHNHGPTPRLSLGPEPSGLDCAQIHPSGRAPSVPRGQPARAQSALDRPGHAHCPQGPASGTVPSTGWLWKEDMHTVLLTGVSKGSAAPWAAWNATPTGDTPEGLGRTRPLCALPARPASNELSSSRHSGQWQGPRLPGSGGARGRPGSAVSAAGSAQTEAPICAPQEEKAPTRSSFWKDADTSLWPRTVLRGKPGSPPGAGLRRGAPGRLRPHCCAHAGPGRPCPCSQPPRAQPVGMSASACDEWQGL